MPTGVIMYLQIQSKISEDHLSALRIEFLRTFQIDPDCFYDETPLVYVPDDDISYMPEMNFDSYWLNVNFRLPFYWVGYERGNIKLFVNCAEWFEKKIDGCLVYYGHDVDDENIGLFDKQSRDKILEYYNNVHGKP